MKFTLLALTFFSILSRYVSPVLAASNVCSTGIYATLAPLAGSAQAQAFCSAKFPAVVVTVTASVRARRVKRNPVPATTSNTNAQKAATTTTKKTTTTNIQDPKSSLLSLLSVQAYNIASTFCSCINPPVTVTVQPSTTTTTPPTTTPVVSQCIVSTDILPQSDCSDCNTNNCVFSATCAVVPYGPGVTTICQDID